MSPNEQPEPTIRDAQTLWGKAVAPGAAPTLSIRNAATLGYSMALSRFRPAERRLDRAGGAADASKDNDFALVSVLGMGGMGVVYSARQVSLDRQIAIKMLQRDDGSDPELAGKFLTEAVVTGDLDHPNIVPVYDVGRAADGSLFYAMKQVKGTSWEKVIRNRSLEENLRILLSVCDAVAYAHDKGVLHRDLKPENVMLGDYGEVLLMDWGLAASLGSDKAADVGSESGLAGTPAYMSPEMARCDLARIGRGSDIYLLGGILYEIITGLRPHGGKDVFECISNAMANRIQESPRRGELIDIARKALATDPSERYESVKAFQEAIRAFQAHAESIGLSAAAEERRTRLSSIDADALYREAMEIVATHQAALKRWPANGVAAWGLRKTREQLLGAALGRGDLSLATSELKAAGQEEELYPIGNRQGIEPLESLRRRVEAAVREAAWRARLVRLSVITALLAVVFTLGVMSVAYVMTRHQRDVALGAKQDALRERDRAVAAELAEAAQRAEVQSTLRRVENENYYNAIALAQKRIEVSDLPQAESMLWAVRPDLRGWEWGLLMDACHPELATLRGHDGAVLSAAFSADGLRAASVGGDSRIILWDVATGAATVALKVEAAAVLAALPGAGRLEVVAVTRDGRVRTLDGSTRRETATVVLEGFDAAVAAVAWASDGTLSGAAGNEVRVWDPGSGRLTRRLAAPAAVTVEFADLAPRANVALVGNGDALLVFDVASAAALTSIAAPHAGAFIQGRLSPDGRRVMVTCRDRTARVYAVANGRPLDVLRGHGDAVLCAAFSPDGLLAATGSQDRDLRLWKGSDASCERRVEAHQGAVNAVGFSPDGRQMLTGGSDGGARLWQAERWQLERAWNWEGEEVASVAFSVDGKRLAAGVGSRLLLMENSAGGEPVAVPMPSPVLGLGVLQDGGWLVVCRDSVERVDSAGGRATRLEGMTDGTRAVAVAPMGALAFLGGRSGELWDVARAARLAELEGAPAAIACAAFTSDGLRVAAGGRDAVCVWEVDSRRRIHALGQGSGVSCMAFSGDGGRLFTGTMGAIRAWDTATGREMLTIAGLSGWVRGLACTPRGGAVAAGFEDGCVRVWRPIPPDATPDSAAALRKSRLAAWLALAAPPATAPAPAAAPSP